MSTALTALIFGVIGISAIILLISFIKSKHFFKCLFFSILQGVVAVAAVNVAGFLTGIRLAVNWYTLGFSALFGTPGAIAIMLMQFIFNK
ncbi:hypothetical protein SDC9_190412 [bioreactor metagenome]|uniref:SigmaK-factor processing regulatory protein BofA n=1 Tax=bioreactor metagenome TaxID=1076179 RepID=A0A645I375_9ZZZZ